MHTIRMKVVPRPKKTGMFFRVTPLPENAPPNLDKYTRSMCSRWFKLIFGTEPPSKTTVFTFQVEEE
jgi:hypothetical protein